jgi:hypothetical protein
MQLSILRRVFVRLRRNAHLCLPALALALTLGAVVSPPPLPPQSKPSVEDWPTPHPLVNWNS